jgi:hypothetical protein
MANPKVAARPAQTPFPEADLLKHGVPPQLERRVRDMQAKGDPLLTDSLLALPEEIEHRAHYAPQRALKGLADLLHGHAEATNQARRYGGKDCLHAYVTVEPGDLAYLMDVISAQMAGMQGLSSVDAALTLRQVSNHLEGEQA